MADNVENNTDFVAVVGGCSYDDYIHIFRSDIMESGITNMSGDCLIGLASTVALAISSQYSADDLVVIGSFLTAVADLILLNAEQKAKCEALQQQNNC